MGINPTASAAAGPYSQVLIATGHMPEVLPTIDLQGRMGNTDYIDFLRAEDLPASICKYVDRYGRPGLAFKFVVVGTGLEYVWCPFQRYTNSPSWSFGWGPGSYELESILNRFHDEEEGHGNRMAFCEECPFSAMKMSGSTLRRLIDGTHPLVRLA
jgi:hypothetical protein